MLRKILLIIPLTIEIGCLSSLPKPPKGDLCVLDIPNENGVCVHIAKVAQKQHLDRDDAHNTVAIKDMDNWIAFSPKTWANIQVYLNELKQIAEEQCK